jgi:integrase
VNALQVSTIQAHWQKELAPWTHHFRARGLRAALRFLDHTTGTDLAQHVRIPRKPKPRDKCLSTEQLSSMLRWATPWQRCWLLLATFLGLRRGDALKVSAQNWFSEARELRWTQQKTGEPHVLPVPDALAEMLDTAPGADPNKPFLERWRGKPLAYRTISNAWAQLARKAGIPRELRPHDLRRTAGAALMDWTKDIRAVQHFLGHLRIENTAHYIGRVAPQEMRDQLRALQQRFPTEMKQ